VLYPEGAGDTRLRVLAEVSRAFSTVATDYRVLVETIARVTADLVGDGCLVSLLDGVVVINAANAHRDPALELVYRELLAGRGVSRDGDSVAATVIRSGEPTVMTEIDPATVVARTEPALRPLIARLNVHSYAVVPIQSPRGIVGSLSLFRSAPGNGYTTLDLVLLRDLADRAGLAIENARAYDELERRVRERTSELQTLNEELEAFSYSVAHDLRAPLRSIDGLSRAVIEDCAEQLPPTGREYLERVRAAAGRMGLLIDALLSLARVRRFDLKREPLDLSALATTVIDGLREAEPHRLIHTVVEPGLAAHADRRLVEIVLTNLISNAWKFTRGLAAPRLEVRAVPATRPTTFLVRDNGAGFEPAQAARLFGAFSRLHGAAFEGSGIGLAIVKRIVLRHGGRVWAEGETGHGATFYFTLEP
jgi:signal transduction histidine kinase